MQASIPLADARQYLRDLSGVRWSDAVLMSYLTRAEVIVIKAFPGANSLTDIIALTPGSIRHETLPARTVKLIRVERNMGTATGAPKAIITRMDKAALDAANTAWGDEPVETILNYAQGPEDNKRFYTYPKAHDTLPMWVEVIVSVMPDNVEASDQELDVPDEFRNELGMLTAGMALMEDDPGADFPRGASLVKQAYLSLGIQLEDEAANEQQ